MPNRYYGTSLNRSLVGSILEQTPAVASHLFSFVGVFRMNRLAKRARHYVSVRADREEPVRRHLMQTTVGITVTFSEGSTRAFREPRKMVSALGFVR